MNTLAQTYANLLEVAIYGARSSVQPSKPVAPKNAAVRHDEGNG